MRKHGIFGAAALCVLLLWGIFCPPAGAAVLSTPEAAGGADSVYVAGNPDWYPIEYYDPDTGCYEGVLPELLERVGEKTGLNFTYIRAGEEDQRLRLARNGQVELVSGCTPDDPVLGEAGVTASGAVLTVPQEGGELEVCFAYTKIAGDGLTAAVEGALGELSRQETAGIAVSFLMERPESAYPAWLFPAGAAAALLLLAVIAVLAVRLRRYQKAAGQDRRFDPVTGIGNKAYFTERFEKFIPDQYRGLYCVVFIGFDIARVNQYYGETEAEEQLHFAANELLLGTADNEIAARVSGGGFAVARPSSGEQEAGAWTETLLERLNRYTEKYGKDYRPDFHAGIYMLQPSDRDCETVLFNVRQGYQRALAGNTAFAFSRPELLRQESEKLELKKQTLEAVQNREFRMFLQFVVRGKSGGIVSAEALSRWDHPQKGLLHPGSYIELMESEKTIAELDFYIFEEACRQLEHWQKQGRKLSISCNFTRITIDHESFIPQLKRIADRYFFERSSLVIEITEDTMENNKETAFANVSRCKALGFRIALDDTGSGYTSFSDLRDYPIDIVKIDRSILNAAVNDRGIALLKGMIALAHSLQMEVLCEGVETAAQADLLRRLECDYLQGYYFYRALPKEEADRLLDTRDRHAEA
ncbi:MAG: EAL domain-containing protein [Oscillospiraceae bacterium]|nr:EAL domain-containing protein [Oscillospiraceae bacterium]